MAITDEFIEVAKELIDEFIPESNAVWVSSPSPEVADPTKPWIVTPAEPTLHNVRILFFPDNLEDRQLQMYLKGTASNIGQVNGIMYQTDFTPMLTDTVRWNNRDIVIRAIDEITPVDRTIIYLLELGL